MGNAQGGALPSSMKRLVLQHPDEDMARARLTVEDAPIPALNSGEVLIKVTAAPVQSDFLCSISSDNCVGEPL
jgi:hypothetical protein